MVKIMESPIQMDDLGVSQFLEKFLYRNLFQILWNCDETDFKLLAVDFEKGDAQRCC